MGGLGNMKDIQIASKLIGPTHKPFIIAEMSGNHNQSLDRSLSIVRVAAKAGVDALKIQTYTPETMTLDSDKEGFIVSNELWKGKSLFQKNCFQRRYSTAESAATVPSDTAVVN